MKEIKFDRFYKYDEMTEFLETVSTKKKDFCKLTVLGETKEKRKIHLMEITDYSTGDAKEKGAYYVQANVHANEGAGTMAALYLIKELLYSDKYYELLKKIAFYIIPRLNPDGADYALSYHAPVRSRYRKIYRKNGLIPKDINEDGYILNMRWKDETGQFREDEIDPRIMIRRQPGDKGPFYNMVTEGEIMDYDGTSIVLGVRNIDFNRNYAIGWKDYDNTGEYPFSETEMRLVADFTTSHPNIFAGVDLHCGTQAILRPSSKPDNEMDQEDLELILSIGKLAEKITGFPLMHTKDYGPFWKNKPSIPGDSKDWFYYKLGVSQYIIELGWGLSSAGIFGDRSLNADSRTHETVFMREVLNFHDSKGSNIFVPWKKFNHPQLGEVEIGGLLTGNARFMYPLDMEIISPKVCSFIVEHSRYHPELIISNADICPVGLNIFRVRATVANIGGFATNIMNDGGSSELRLPVRVKIVCSDKIEILSRVLIYEINNLKELGGCEQLEWFIRANKHQRIIIEAYHPKAGRVKNEYTL